MLVLQDEPTSRSTSAITQAVSSGYLHVGQSLYRDTAHDARLFNPGRVRPTCQGSG
jgi:hypothetical protein